MLLVEFVKRRPMNVFSLPSFKLWEIFREVEGSAPLLAYPSTPLWIELQMNQIICELFETWVNRGSFEYDLSIKHETKLSLNFVVIWQMSQTWAWQHSTRLGTWLDYKYAHACIYMLKILYMHKLCN